MLHLLAHRTFGRLFAAQVIALLGTGLMTVALGLLAYDLAGDRAGAVLGTALAIKMVAYVGLSPVANALAEGLPRKLVLIAADLARAAVALALPFVDSVWQIYGLIFLLQAASATFTPTFQATIPDILPDEGDYTRALSLSRLAYDIENLVSPAMAGLLLLVISYHGLFAGTVVGFLGSALLVATTRLPARRLPERRRSFADRLTRGLRIYLATPRLRGMLALNLGASGASAFVIVNTVVIVRAGYGASEAQVAYALAAFGGGSMLSALALPRLLERTGDRPVMTAATGGIALLLLACGIWLTLAGLFPWPLLLAAWALAGVLYSAILTPSGRLLRRSSHADDRPALFAAQFALAHACWLVSYPLAGRAGAALGMGPTLLILGAMALAGLLLALRLWPAGDPLDPPHRHPELAPDHPHLRAHGTAPHRHALVIDDTHPRWPRHG